MIRKIRHSVFETNSSSTHSISLDFSKELVDKPYFEMDIEGVDNHGNLYIYSGEFGWEEEEFTRSIDKASYAYTWAMNYGQESHMNLLEKVLLKGNKVKKVIFKNSRDESYPYGYIDHQSVDICENAFDNEDKLTRFIFDKNCVLRTDNDNK